MISITTMVLSWSSLLWCRRPCCVCVVCCHHGRIQLRPGYHSLQPWRPLVSGGIRPGSCQERVYGGEYIISFLAFGIMAFFLSKMTWWVTGSAASSRRGDLYPKKQVLGAQVYDESLVTDEWCTLSRQCFIPFEQLSISEGGSCEEWVTSRSGTPALPKG